MAGFRREVWDEELGKGGLIGDLTDIDRSPVGVITTGELRRFVPVWNNESRVSPCQASCPTGIPVQKRWALVRKGDIEGAVDLALAYTPFPATVCGYLCPNLCMEGCTRAQKGLVPIDTSLIGKASLEARPPKRSSPTGKRIAVIGGGPAGLSVAWQLWLKGHEPEIFDRNERLGGKIRDVIPHSRIPANVFEHELARVEERVRHTIITELDEDLFMDIVNRHEYTVIAVGANDPRTLKVEGAPRAMSALDFLKAAKRDKMKVGRRVVVIGAGNVGCDVATEAYRLGAREVTLVDIQRPASFGRERAAAESLGARFLWPVRTEAVTAKGVILADGRVVPADLVVFSIGDTPDLRFLPDSVDIQGGFVKVDGKYRTSLDTVYAIGDSVRPGLITDAIGAGRMVAQDIDARIRGLDETFDRIPAIDPERIRLEYYEPVREPFPDMESMARACASCGLCRDCGLCEAVCPQQAISRRSLQDGKYEYVVDERRCIGCGFCAGSCPCGIWELRENDPIG